MPHDRSQNSEEPRTDSRATHDRSAADGRAQTRQINRRDCLRLGTATVLSAAGLTTGASAATTRYGITFEKVVDATDFGADPSGSSDSAGAIEDAIDEKTLVVFPPGEYKIGSTISTWRDRFGFYGDGDVRFVPTDGFNDEFINVGPDEFLFENIDIDIRADDTVTGFGIRAKSRMVVQDVEFIGRGTHPDGDVTNAFSVRIGNANGVGILRNVTAKKGSAIGRYKGGDGRVGVFCGPGSEGTLRIENCHFEEFGNNALYCSRTPGDVKVRDSYFRNNNVASVRLSGEGSIVENSRIVVDMEKYSGPTDSTSSSFNTRCVWFEQARGRFDFPAGVAIDGCDIIVRNAWQSAGAVVAQGGAKTVDISDTRIRVDSDRVRAVNRLAPSRGTGAVRMKGVSIVGSSDGNEAVFLEEADYSTVRNSCIYTPGSRKTGITVENASGCSVKDTNISADSNQIEEKNCSVSVSGLTDNDGCPINGHLSNTLTVESVGDEAKVEYEFETTDELAKEDSANAGDTVDGTTASGVVQGGGQDGYRFDGELSSFSVVSGTKNDVAVLVNGSEIISGATRSLTIQSTGSEDYIDYEVTTSGDLSKGKYADSDDTIDGSTATGSVGGGWKDSYEFSGEVTGFTVTRGDPASVDVYVDGEKTDFGGQSHSMTIQSTGSEEYIDYEVTTSGDLSKGKYANSGDTIDGSTATGSVGGGWRDSYEFSGEVTSFTVLRGDPASVDVYVDGEKTALADLDRTVTVQSTGSENYVKYELVTDGTIRLGEYTNSGDSVSGSTATGSVGGGWKDSYRLSGDVTGFTVTRGDAGDVDVYVDGSKQY